MDSDIFNMYSYNRIAVLSALMLVMLPFVHAAFPYNAPWLSYGAERFVYKIDTSSVTDNSADIYVTLSIDPTSLQNFINKWGGFCDPDNIYPWFYPVFAYASTGNMSERMAQVVEFNGWQNFNVPSCGTVSLPTQFKIKLPNGVLDGGSNFANYDHYIYAYLKYPYTWDFSEALVPNLPPSLHDAAGTTAFSTSFGEGVEYKATTPRSYFVTDIPIQSGGKTYVCAWNKEESEIIPDLWIKLEFDNDENITKTYYLVGRYCVDISDNLPSGVSRISKIYLWNDTQYSDWYYLRVITQSIIDRIYNK